MNHHLDTIRCIYHSRPNQHRAESHAKLRYGTHDEALKYIVDRLYQPSAEVERILLEMRKSPQLAFEYVYRMMHRNGWEKRVISDSLKALICTDPYLCYRYAASIVQCACPELEHIICKDGLASAHYASEVLHKPFPQGEKEIALSPRAANYYATNTLKGPFPEGEDAIATDPSLSVNYAMFLQKRFVKGEKVILTDAKSAGYYAKHVIKGRWKEAERIISQDGMSAYTYAIEVVKQRWKRGEAAIAKITQCYYPTFYAEKILKERFPLYEKEIIKQYENASNKLFIRCVMYYIHHVVQDRFTAAEPIIACHPQESLEYAQLIKNRFPLGEAIIATDKKISLQYAKHILKPLNLL